MSKKKKVIITIATAVFLVCLAAVFILLNIDSIYVASEKGGVFCRPVDIKQSSLSDTVRYTFDELERDSRVTFDQSLMLINRSYLLSDDFVPAVSEYSDTDVYMNDCMLEAYASLSSAVMNNSGKKLYVSSDFRSADEQDDLYRDDPFTATLPGASEHQSGLALDVYVAHHAGDGFIKSHAGRFVNSNSWKYGFIIRYPCYAEDVTGIRYEPWHIRYVGHPHADVIYNNHTTLEEYVFALNVGQWYEIAGYFVCRQQLNDGKLLLPAEFTDCVISPDNTGYYIITLK